MEHTEPCRPGSPKALPLHLWGLPLTLTMSSSPNLRLHAHDPCHHGRTCRPVFLLPSRTLHTPARSHRNSSSWRTQLAIGRSQARFKPAWLHSAQRDSRSDSTTNSVLDASRSCLSFPLSLILAASPNFCGILSPQTPASRICPHTHFHGSVAHSFQKPKIRSNLPTSVHLYPPP